MSRLVEMVMNETTLRGERTRSSNVVYDSRRYYVTDDFGSVGIHDGRTGDLLGYFVTDRESEAFLDDLLDSPNGDRVIDDYLRSKRGGLRLNDSTEAGLE